MQKEIAIGATINSLRYCFVKDVPLVYVDAKVPHRFSDCAEEFHKLYFCLSLAGKIINGDGVVAIRHTDEGLRVISSHTATAIKAKKYLVFDTAGTVGLTNVRQSPNQLYEVLDWVDVLSGMKHSHDRIDNSADFINSLRFYPTSRVHGNRNLKDLCVKSYLTADQLASFEYSELVVRIKAQEVMEAAGIKGPSNGGGKRLAIKLRSSHREIFPTSEPDYEDLPANYFSYRNFQISKLISTSPYLNTLYSTWGNQND